MVAAPRTLTAVSVVRDDDGRTVEIRTPISALTSLPISAPTYWTKVNSVAVIETAQGQRPIPVEAWLRLPGQNLDEAYDLMAVTIEAEARPALMVEVERIQQAVAAEEQAARQQAAGRILGPSGRR